MATPKNKLGNFFVLMSILISSVAAQQCSKVIKANLVDLNNYTDEEVTLSCPSGFTVNMQFVKLVQAYKADTGNQIIVECVIEPIYQYHSLCLGKENCTLTNPDSYKDIRGCNDQGNGTNYFDMEYFCDAKPVASEEMSICEDRIWTGSQLYLYSSPPGTEAITNTNCKCVITLQEQSEMAAYVGSFTKESNIEGFDLNYNPCQQKVQMTTFKVYETPYVQRSFCSRFAGLARESCSNRMKIIYLEFNSVTPWVSVNFSLSFSSPADKPMKVECGITDVLGRPTNPPPSTTPTTTTTPEPTTTAEPTTTPKPTTTPATTTETTAPTTQTTTTAPTTTAASTTTMEQTTTSNAPSPTPTTTSTPTTSSEIANDIPPGSKPKNPASESEPLPGKLPITLIVAVTGGVLGAFILIGMIAAAVCAKKRKTTDKAAESAAAGAQLSGDGSVYHVYEYVEPGARYSGVYAQPDEGSISPVYPSYPRPMPDTLSSTPGYLDPPPDYPMDSLQNQRNERIQQHSYNRYPSHTRHTAIRTPTSPKKHAHFERDVEYMEQEEDVATNPLYGQAHDLFFAY